MLWAFSQAVRQGLHWAFSASKTICLVKLLYLGLNPFVAVPCFIQAFFSARDSRTDSPLGSVGALNPFGYRNILILSDVLQTFDGFRLGFQFVPQFAVVEYRLGRPYHGSLDLLETPEGPQEDTK